MMDEMKTKIVKDSEEYRRLREGAVKSIMEACEDAHSFIFASRNDTLKDDDGVPIGGMAVLCSSPEPAAAMLSQIISDVAIGSSIGVMEYTRYVTLGAILLSIQRGIEPDSEMLKYVMDSESMSISGGDLDEQFYHMTNNGDDMYA